MAISLGIYPIFRQTHNPARYHQPTVPKASLVHCRGSTFHLVYGGLKLPDLFVQAQNVLGVHKWCPGHTNENSRVHKQYTNGTESSPNYLLYPSKKWMQLESQYDLCSSILIHFVPKFSISSISFPAI